MSQSQRRFVQVAAIAIGVGLVAAAASGGVHRGIHWTVSVGRALALAAGMLFMLQFALSARFAALDAAFGLDRLLLAHRAVGALAATLACLHPAFLYATDLYDSAPLAAGNVGEVGGLVAIATIVFIVCTSAGRVFLGLNYEAWRRLHWLTFLLVAMVSSHGFKLGADLEGGWVRYLWIAVFVAYVAAFVWVKIVRPRRLRAQPHTVRAVSAVSPNVTALDLAPPEGSGLCHLPGQFAFLTLLRKGERAEEHPFTIASAPRPDGSIAFAIKASGDFTATVPSVQPGDRAVVHGPFGRFSHALEDPGDLLLIAGGIGITPLLSMLRQLVDEGDDRGVTLVWANRTEADIVFRDELAAMPERLSNLTVHHVLSRQPDWQGERGHIDAAMLERLLTPRDRKARVYVCGPPPMMVAVRTALRGLGFPRARIHTESFTF